LKVVPGIKTSSIFLCKFLGPKNEVFEPKNFFLKNVLLNVFVKFFGDLVPALKAKEYYFSDSVLVLNVNYGYLKKKKISPIVPVQSSQEI
jgi:hypothetical protein